MCWLNRCTYCSGGPRQMEKHSVPILELRSHAGVLNSLIWSLSGSSRRRFSGAFRDETKTRVFAAM